MTNEDRLLRAIRDAMGWGGRGVELNALAESWSMREAGEFLRSLQDDGFTVIETPDDVSAPPDVHVMPSGWDHESSPECWCRPRIEETDPVNEGRVWVHGAPA